jgi:hypothetical protein
LTKLPSAIEGSSLISFCATGGRVLQPLVS